MNFRATWTSRIALVAFFLLFMPRIGSSSDKASELKIELRPTLTPALQAVDKDLRDAVITLEANFEKSGVIYDDPALTEYLNGLLSSQDLGVPESDFKFSARILKLPDENAFAFPSGNIYVNAGIIALTKNADELRFILAHEAMHVIGKHIVFHQKSFRDHTTFMKLLDIAIVPAASIANIYTDFQYTSLIGGIADLTGTAAGLFYVASVQGYGRAHEIEADHYGCRVMSRMGKGVSAPVSFFRSFQQFHQKYIGAEFTHFASSHESTGDRLKRAKELADDPSTLLELSSDPEYMAVTRAIRLDVSELNIKLGRVHRAIDALTMIEPLSNEDARLQYLMGEAYRQLAEDPQLSKRELTRKEWLQIAKPGDAKLKDIWKARSVERYERAIKTDATFASPHRGLAQFHEMNEEWAKAESAYAKYLSLSGEVKDARFVNAKIRSMQQKLADSIAAGQNTNKKG